MGLFVKRNIDTALEGMPKDRKREVLRLMKGLRHTRLYTNPKIDNAAKKKEFIKRREFTVGLIKGINAIMKECDREPLFFNAYDYNVVGRDYVRLMTKVEK